MKAAKIGVRRPGRGDLFDHVRLRREEIDAIHAAFAGVRKLDRDFAPSCVDADGGMATHVTLTPHSRPRLPQERPTHAVVFP